MAWEEPFFWGLQNIASQHTEGSEDSIQIPNDFLANLASV